MQDLFADDWTLDPSVFSYNITWRPPNYVKGLLAESWEFTDPTTWVVHLHQGIHWQNIPPVNGREFTADDVVYQYDRMLGLGDGFTTPSLSETGVPSWQSLVSITANDKYTVAFKWETSNVEFILDTMFAFDDANFMVAPEAVKEWGDLSDWHHAMGTGPFILQDFISGSSATLIKNPNYWGYDERYPQNKLPYVDSLKYLIMPDDATALSAMRAGKIDAIDGISATDAQSMKKTNPEILQISIPLPECLSLDPRYDKAPFTDIKVRQALQMSIDLKGIADNYYNGTATPYPSSLTSEYEPGWGFPYEEWPQDLKDQYAYNPTAAKKLLSDAGYSNGFKTNIVANAGGDISVLQIVQSEFAAVNVDMVITTMDNVSWQSFVRGRKFNQMAFSPSGSFLGLSYDPIRQLQQFMTTNSGDWTSVSDPVFDAFYPKALAANDVDAVKQVLIDANKYVAEQHFCLSLLQPMTYSLCQPWLKGFNGQNFSISGFMGPPLIGFYGARFWTVGH